jgi:hypothetical protein
VLRLQLPGGEQNIEVFPLLNRRNGNRNGNQEKQRSGVE